MDLLGFIGAISPKGIKKPTPEELDTIKDETGYDLLTIDLYYQKVKKVCKDGKITPQAIATMLEVPKELQSMFIERISEEHFRNADSLKFTEFMLLKPHDLVVKMLKMQEAED